MESIFANYCLFFMFFRYLSICGVIFYELFAYFGSNYRQLIKNKLWHLVSNCCSICKWRQNLRTFLVFHWFSLFFHRICSSRTLFCFDSHQISSAKTVVFILWSYFLRTFPYFFTLWVLNLRTFILWRLISRTFLSNFSHEKMSKTFFAP